MMGNAKRNQFAACSVQNWWCWAAEPQHELVAGLLGHKKSYISALKRKEEEENLPLPLVMLFLLQTRVTSCRSLWSSCSENWAELRSTLSFTRRMRTGPCPTFPQLEMRGMNCIHWQGEKCVMFLLALCKKYPNLNHHCLLSFCSFLCFLAQMCISREKALCILVLSDPLSLVLVSLCTNSLFPEKTSITRVIGTIEAAFDVTSSGFLQSTCQFKLWLSC